MGISWGSRRRNNYLHGYPPLPHLLPSPYVYASESQPVPPTNNLIHPHHNYVHAFPAPYPPPICVPHSCYPSYPPSTAFAYYPSPVCSASSTLVVRPVAPVYAFNQSSGWTAPQPAALPFQAPPPFVEHENAKKVRSDINVHRDTLQLEIDELNPDHYLVSFVFDALSDGSFTISYFAKEEPNCKFTQQFPEVSVPIKLPFQKGLGQKFFQPSGTGIDLGFFELEDLAKPSPAEDVFPLVITAEAHALSHSATEHDTSFSPGSSSPHIQVTQAVLEKNGYSFNPKVAKQILWADGVRYELREIYGIASSSADSDPGKACVICMSEQKDIALLPCRHMCLCSGCAMELRVRSNKCPVCRQPIEELLEIFS